MQKVRGRPRQSPSRNASATVDRAGAPRPGTASLKVDHQQVSIARQRLGDHARVDPGMAKNGSALRGQPSRPGSLAPRARASPTEASPRWPGPPRRASPSRGLLSAGRGSDPRSPPSPIAEGPARSRGHRSRARLKNSPGFGDLLLEGPSRGGGVRRPAGCRIHPSPVTRRGGIRRLRLRRRGVHVVPIRCAGGQ